jgi:hypothetical protein
MEKIITDSLNNTITMKYDETNDLISVKNSAVRDVFMEVIKKTPDYLEYDTWSDDITRIELKLFWDLYKVTK